AVACIHPGWAPLVGRSEVMASWRGILSNPQSPAIACRRPEVFMQGMNAFVVCYETFDGNFLIATNLFQREAGGWKLIHHPAGARRNRGPGGALHALPFPPLAAARAAAPALPPSGGLGIVATRMRQRKIRRDRQAVRQFANFIGRLGVIVLLCTTAAPSLARA